MAWQIDTAHSHILFSVRHMMISMVRGHFEDFSGVVHLDEENPEHSSVEVTIQAGSVSTREEQRDNHLRSPDFLDVEQYPVISFKSTRVEQIDERHGRVYGDLTIRGVTREVVLDVEYMGKAKSPWGTTSAGFSATTTLDRKNWGLAWNQALETGGVLVGDKMKVEIDVELIQQEEQAEAEAEFEAVAAGD